MIDLVAIQHVPSVAKAMKQLHSLSQRPLAIKHKDDWVPTEPDDTEVLPSAAYVRTKDRDEVYIDDTLPEHMAVHELIHPILCAEGYPDVRLVKRPELRYTETQECTFLPLIDGIKDSLEHHEVHRRMRDTFGLDMALYYKHKAEKHSVQLDEIVANVSRDVPFVIQKEIIDVLEMLEYRHYFGDSFDSYAEATPWVIKSCECLLLKVRPIGFSSPRNAQKCYDIIKGCLVGLGEHWKMNEAENDLWRGLEFPLGSPDAKNEPHQ